MTSFLFTKKSFGADANTGITTFCFFFVTKKIIRNISAFVEKWNKTFRILYFYSVMGCGTTPSSAILLGIIDGSTRTSSLCHYRINLIPAMTDYPIKHNISGFRTKYELFIDVNILSAKVP